MSFDFQVKADFRDNVTSGLRELNNQTKTTNKSLDGMAKAAKSVAVGLGAAFGARAVFKGIKSLTTDVMAFTDRIDKASQRVGLSYKAFQEWDYAMTLSGTSLKETEKGLQRFQKNIVDAYHGTGTATEAITNLGVELKTVNGTFRANEDLFEDTIMALAGMEDITLRNAYAQDIFGQSGAKIVPLLNSGTEAIRANKKELEEMGAIIGDASIMAGANLTDSFEKLNRSINKLKIHILAPMMSDLSGEIEELIKSGDLKKWIEDVEAGAKSLYEELKPVLTTFKDFSMILVENLDVALGVISAIALPAAVIAMNSFTAAVYANTVALMANPIGLVAVAAAAAVTAIYKLTRAWDKWRDSIQEEVEAKQINTIKTGLEKLIGLYETVEIESKKAAGVAGTDEWQRATKDIEVLETNLADLGVTLGHGAGRADRARAALAKLNGEVDDNDDSIKKTTKSVVVYSKHISTLELDLRALAKEHEVNIRLIDDIVGAFDRVSLSTRNTLSANKDYIKSLYDMSFASNLSWAAVSNAIEASHDALTSLEDLTNSMVSLGNEAAEGAGKIESFRRSLIDLGEGPSTDGMASYSQQIRETTYQVLRGFEDLAEESFRINSVTASSFSSFYNELLTIESNYVSKKEEFNNTVKELSDIRWDSVQTELEAQKEIEKIQQDINTLQEQRDVGQTKEEKQEIDDRIEAKREELILETQRRDQAKAQNAEALEQIEKLESRQDEYFDNLQQLRDQQREKARLAQEELVERERINQERQIEDAQILIEELNGIRSENYEEEYERKIERLQQDKELELQYTAETEEEKKAIILRYDAEIAKLNRKALDNKYAAAKKTLSNFGAAASSIADNVTKTQVNAARKRIETIDREISTIDDSTEAGQLRVRALRKQKEEEMRIARQVFNKRKKFLTAIAVMEGAVATAKAWKAGWDTKGPWYVKLLNAIAASAAAAAPAAAEVATIQAQQFQQGGFPEGRNALIQVNEDGQEAVLNAQATSNLGEAAINSLNDGATLEDITGPQNRFMGGGFAAATSILKEMSGKLDGLVHLNNIEAILVRTGEWVEYLARDFASFNIIGSITPFGGIITSVHGAQGGAISGVGGLGSMGDLKPTSFAEEIKRGPASGGGGAGESANEGGMEVNVTINIAGNATNETVEAMSDELTAFASNLEQVFDNRMIDMSKIKQPLEVE